MFRATPRIVLLAIFVLGFSVVAHGQLIISGYNESLDPGPPISVPFNPTGGGQWFVQATLLFVPEAPPMIKEFDSPRLPTGAPAVLDALQPQPILVTEFYTIAGNAGTPFSGKPVTDWHEKILTPGWQWVTPGNPLFPGLFPDGTSLITRDNQPWPSVPLDPAIDPTAVNVLFPQIDIGHVLDIHKALLWVGTDTQRFWGDDQTESIIRVIEHPTPEPSSFVLAVVGLAALAVLRARRQKRTG
jgi:hypothetical protein